MKNENRPSSLEKELSERIISFYEWVDKVYDERFCFIDNLSDKAKKVLFPLSRILKDWSDDI